MRIITTGRPVQEIAAEPTTLARLRSLLDHRPTPPAPARGRLLDLPLVVDPAIPPLTVLLRPHTTPMGPLS